MLLEFDIQKLEKAINSFSDAMGVSISILYEDYSVIGSKKLKNPYCHLVQGNKRGLTGCMDSNCTLLEKCKSSKKAQMHICHAGLVEMAIPILHGDDVIGYVSFGHIRTAEQGEDISRYLSELPVDIDEARVLYSSLPPFEREKITAIIDMAEMFVEYIMSQRLLKPKENETFEAVRQYVFDNYDKKLTAQTIAAGTHLSKTALYNVIKRYSGYSVNEYINTVKIEKSKKMLTDTDMSVEEISERLRFSGTAYYSRLFKKHVGVSPSVFRKQNS